MVYVRVRVSPEYQTRAYNHAAAAQCDPAFRIYARE
jgi:hypothetical protein